MSKKTTPKKKQPPLDATQPAASDAAPTELTIAVPTLEFVPLPRDAPRVWAVSPDSIGVAALQNDEALAVPEADEPGERHGLFRFLHGTKGIDLVGAREQLDEVEAQLGHLFDGIWSRPTAGMHLSQIEVSLTVTAEGSIGIASAGAQVAFALTYEPGPASSSRKNPA